MGTRLQRDCHMRTYAARSAHNHSSFVGLSIKYSYRNVFLSNSTIITIMRKERAVTIFSLCKLPYNCNMVSLIHYSSQRSQIGMRRRMTFEALRVIPGSLPHVNGCSTSEPVTVITRQGCSFIVPHLTRRSTAQTIYHRMMGRLVNDGKGYGRKRSWVNLRAPEFTWRNWGIPVGRYRCPGRNLNSEPSKGWTLDRDVCWGKMYLSKNEEIKKRSNSGNACCQAVQNLLSSHLLSKRYYKNIKTQNVHSCFVAILSPLPWGGDRDQGSWGEHLDPGDMKRQVAGGKSTMRRSTVRPLNQIGRAGHATRTSITEIRNALKIWSENLRERNHLEDPCVDGRTVLRYSGETGREGVDWIDTAFPPRFEWRQTRLSLMALCLYIVSRKSVDYYLKILMSEVLCEAGSM